jgi:hypothetical protein
VIETFSASAFTDATHTVESSTWSPPHVGRSWWPTAEEKVVFGRPLGIRRRALPPVGATHREFAAKLKLAGGGAHRAWPRKDGKHGGADDGGVEAGARTGRRCTPWGLGASAKRR